MLKITCLLFIIRHRFTIAKSCVLRPSGNVKCSLVF